jgi:hypothetical protein
MKLYENVVIGHFLFALGFHTHRVAPASGTLPVMINLLQQTPEDKNLGDVLLQLPAQYARWSSRRSGASARSGSGRPSWQRRCPATTSILKPFRRAIHWYRIRHKAGLGLAVVGRRPVRCLPGRLQQGHTAHTSLEGSASAMADEGADPAAAIEPSLVGNYLSLVS